jgi:protein phosphatase
MLQWYGFGSSHQGLVRTTNQDAFLVDNSLQLWAVADGMGGHPGGDVASRLVIETIAREAAAEAARLQHGAPHIDALLKRMVESAHSGILDYARLHPGLLGMGTTLTLLHISRQSFPTATLVHEGDSRAYLIRNGVLIQLTRDHSMVEEYVRQGLLTSAQALHHPERHVLSRAVGIGPTADVDVTIERLEPGDRIMLCTDGLTKMMDDVRLADAVSAGVSHPESICQTLLSAALEAGGLDNVTVLAVQACGGKIR